MACRTFLLTPACGDFEVNGMDGKSALRYIPLGDSLTYGNAVPAADAWPNQLVALLAAEAAAAGRLAPLELVGNLAVSGFTTRHVRDIELVQLESFRPELSSLLVGGNDVIQGIDEDEYRTNLETIIDGMEALTGRGRIFGVTIPDLSATPGAAEHADVGLPTLGPRLAAYSDIFCRVLGDRRIPVAHISDIALAGARDPALLSRDGLHPSGRQYAQWVERIAPVARELLRL